MPSVDELLNESLLELSESETWERVEGYDVSEYFSDEQQMVQIDSKNRTIGSLSENVSVFEENNSQYVTFIMDRYLDGIDLSTKTFNVQYENKSENIWGSNSPVDFYRSETRIKFGWLINNVATQKPIVLDIIVFCIGYVDTKEYVFKTRPMQYTIYNSNEIGGGEEHRPDDNWYIQFVEQQVALVNESKGYRNEAAQSASSANASKLSALESEQLASGYATSASQSANSASQSSTSAASDATKAQSYAVGGTGTREGEDTDNAKYYYEETRSISPTGVNERLDALEDKTEVLGSVKTIDFSPSIEFDDGLAVDAKDVKVAFEPQQDLHGYDKPWAGGAGKNKLPLVLADIKGANTSGTWTGNSYVINGVTFDLLTDGDENIVGVKANGENTGSTRATLNICTVQTLNSLLDGSYVFSGCPSDGSESTYRMFLGSSLFNTGDDVNFSTPIAGNNCGISIYQGYNAQNLMFYPMIRLAAETDPTFAPYSNFCPPTGYTNCELEVKGKNLLQNTATTNTVNGVTYTVNSDGSVVASGTANGTAVLQICNKIPIDVSWGTVTLSGLVNTTNLVWNSVILYDDSDTVVERIVTTGSGQNKNNKTFNLADYPTVTKILVSIKRGGASDGVVSGTIYPQLEKGSTATTYEPYQSNTHTIDLDGTRYGGTVDFVSGEMRVTHTFNEFDGSSDENWTINGTGSGQYPFVGIVVSDNNTTTNIISNEFTATTIYTNNQNVGVYKSTTNLRVRPDFALTDVTAWKTWLSNNPLQVCYPLSTPFTVQLTPEQIRTLEGTNNITTNMDAIAIEYYGVNSAIGVLQNQLDGVKEVTIRVPEPPDTNGNYVLSVTVSDSGKSYAWVSN